MCVLPNRGLASSICCVTCDQYTDMGCALQQKTIRHKRATCNTHWPLCVPNTSPARACLQPALCKNSLQSQWQKPTVRDRTCGDWVVLTHTLHHLQPAQQQSKGWQLREHVGHVQADHWLPCPGCCPQYTVHQEWLSADSWCPVLIDCSSTTCYYCWDRHSVMLTVLWVPTFAGGVLLA